jgi:hypothetical protein
VEQQEEKQERRSTGPRRTSLLPVSIHGCDLRGKQFKQVACTLNISHDGARLIGLQRRLKIGSSVALSYHQEQGRFRVVWTRRDSGGRLWEAGLRCLEPEGGLWVVELGSGLDPEDSRQLLKQVFAGLDG